MDIPVTADYLIIGGGTAGLVVACRLSEDPNTHIVVVESGPDASGDHRVQNPSSWPSLSGSELDWKFKIGPQSGLNGREQDHPAGKVLGGSSAINGLAYVPPSPAGIDAWTKLGNPNWNWETLRPYLQKSYTLTKPESGLASSQGSKRDSQEAIQVSYPGAADKQGIPLSQAWAEAFQSEGYKPTDELLAEGKTIGTRNYTATIDPVSGFRSSADSTYGVIASKRPNVTIITETTVRRIIFSYDTGNTRATGLEAFHDGEVITIQTKQEIILAAGALQTPKMLELSGIGNKDRLARLGIPLVIHQPGVGENLQNHVMSLIPVSLKPHEGIAGISPGFKGLAFACINQEEQTKLFAALGNRSSPSNRVVESILNNPNEASAMLFLVVRSESTALLGTIPSFPLSRGSVHITSSDPNDMPVIDARFFDNELDLEILARHVQHLNQLSSAPALEPFFQTSAEVPDLAEIKVMLREKAALTTHHVCGTAAMLPREVGGVVGQDLKVYGTENLRIVDASVFPLIPHANPIATVYAVAERAADIIRGK
ncbi:hypothetical protein N7471_007828 [Penicillium samsonianum]|uniref:uncharacterized protein n=1 Tax=Penicillium samsonianum TaxID=1882272 RepID=UPI0025466C59|nr:uncharacterized protein N7471_007828 [Penicillium samsonianum]KAJ6132613.1 hypothetical protein N7471_007828 [Penicillium samsonianum]